MNVLTVLLLIMISIFYYHWAFRRSVIGISVSTGAYPGFFIIYDFIVYIASSALLLNIFPIDKFWVAFKVNQADVFPASLIVLVSYLLFLINLKYFSKKFPKYFIFVFPSVSVSDARVYRRFVYCAVVASALLIFIGWFFFGAENSFSSSIVSGESISLNRAELRGNIVTKFFGYFFIIVAPLFTVIVASPVFDGFQIKRFIMLACLLYIASWGGGKEPVLSLFLIYFVTWATFRKFKISPKGFFQILLFLICILYATYEVVLWQYPQLLNVNEFFDYIFQRMFVAQMIGFYEEFSLKLQDYSYFWHGVPFASFFIDYPIFQKELMMISEDRIDASSIGIKNTYFMAEAYAMGGAAFLLPSIFIYSVNYLISYVVMVYSLNKIICKNIEYNKLIVSVFLFSYISVTGGFSELIFYKAIIMLFLLLSPIYLLGHFAKFRFKLNFQ